MTTKRTDAFSIDEALRDPGFTPRLRDVALLLDRVEGDDRDVQRAATAALLRVQADFARALVTRMEARDGGALAHLVRLAGRVAGEREMDAALVRAISKALASSDAQPRKAAASALGRLRPPGAEALLADALEAERANGGPEHVAIALAEALGKVGGSRASAALEALPADVASSDKVKRARLMIDRTLHREDDSVIDLDRDLGRGVSVVFRCRPGLEPILASELSFEQSPHFEAMSGRVVATLTTRPNELYRARTFVDFAFVLPRVTQRGDSDVVPVAEALGAPLAKRIFETLTTGTARFRLSWDGSGKRRGETWSLAEALATKGSKLVNDPTHSHWDVAVRKSGPRSLSIELTPNVVDPRFTYRTHDVPASSHPTVAAALVRFAGLADDDVVWDPFVGSGLELCERTIAGRFAQLIGTDIDEDALDAARANLGSLDVKAVLQRADARTFDPRRVTGPARGGLTAVITNPPMGQRSRAGDDIGQLLVDVMTRAAESLRKGGRLVLVSPTPGRTKEQAPRTLALTRSLPIDMGGFRAELQRFEKL